MDLSKLNKYRYAKVLDIMSGGGEKIGDKILRKLYEKTVNSGVETVDRQI